MQEWELEDRTSNSGVLHLACQPWLGLEETTLLLAWDWYWPLGAEAWRAAKWSSLLIHTCLSQAHTPAQAGACEPPLALGLLFPPANSTHPHRLWSSDPLPLSFIHRSWCQCRLWGRDGGAQGDRSEPLVSMSSEVFQQSQAAWETAPSGRCSPAPCCCHSEVQDRWARPGREVVLDSVRGYCFWKVVLKLSSLRSPLVMGWIVSPQNSYVEVLTPNTTECGLVWK